MQVGSLRVTHFIKKHIINNSTFVMLNRWQGVVVERCIDLNRFVYVEKKIYRVFCNNTTCIYSVHDCTTCKQHVQTTVHDYVLNPSACLSTYSVYIMRILRHRMWPLRALINITEDLNAASVALSEP